jgi:shikimate dehydrogenase
LEQSERPGRQTNITSKTRLYGVFGHPVGHSLSPLMQNAAMREMGLDAVYLAFDVPPEELEAALRGLAALGAGGVNLTIPLKEHVLGLLDWVAPEAERIGAVNTVRFSEGRMEGYNTDAPGFLASLRGWGMEPAGKQCVVLGAGGSARAVAVALLGAGARLTLTNRTEERALELAQILMRGEGDSAAPGAVTVAPFEEKALAEALADAELLVNTTSVGMTPHADAPPPAPAMALHPRLFVYDLIYNPAETRLLAAARERGARTRNGIGMLAYQGALALEIWTGRPAPAATMERVLREAVGG